jgi:hypothetical protein
VKPQLTGPRRGHRSIPRVLDNSGPTIAPPAARPLAATLEHIAQALDRADLDMGERALARARTVERDAFGAAVAAGRETLQMAPFARTTRVHFARYVRAHTQIDMLITSVKTLSRAVVRALTLGENVPPPMPGAIRDLSSAVRRLEESLDDPHGEVSVREPALRAAGQASLVLEQTGTFPPARSWSRFARRRSAAQFRRDASGRRAPRPQSSPPRCPEPH